MTKRAALYLRQSKTDDEGIERQTERTTALATARGWHIVATYVDNDVSASKTRGDQTAWGRMLAHSDDIDVVIGVDLDRVVRSTRDINVLIDHGLMLVTVDGEIDLTTADGEFRATMLASIARFEVRRKGERQSRANIQRAASGGVPKGTRLTGYDSTGKVIKAEAKIVKRVFTEFNNRKALTNIAKGLDADGIAPRNGGSWSPSSIRTILMNARYAGRRVYLGEVVAQPETATWKPIVTEAVFDVAQGILSEESRKKNREGTARKYLGSGLFQCFECRVFVRTNGQRYSCPRCGRVRTMAPINEVVTTTVVARLRQPDMLSALAQPLDEAEDRRLADIVGEARAQLINVERDYDEGIIDGRRYAAATERASTKLREAQTARAALVGSEALSSVASAVDPGQAFLDADLDMQRSIVDACMFVLIKPGRRGVRGFDPEDVICAWRRTRLGDGDPVRVVPEGVVDNLTTMRRGRNS